MSFTGPTTQKNVLANGSTFKLFLMQQNGGYWVATNRHVVQEHSIICVVTADRKAAGGVVWPWIRVGTNDSLDLALIWLPRKSKDPLLAASLRQK